ncbi:hypothetical protein B1756_04975 [Natrarchaeobaculum aegyptiacum]|uniref:histidine kinase n=1 Tax=Natrarchaeobaculum aegyptiacum TaxID=745377 RepID=A0A2Z2HWF8_9EURY|nr:hypothetical protein B1756_04975 [Natrarchaeobaculum aegyptiacum]
MATTSWNVLGGDLGVGGSVGWLAIFGSAVLGVAVSDDGNGCNDLELLTAQVRAFTDRLEDGTGSIEDAAAGPDSSVATATGDPSEVDAPAESSFELEREDDLGDLADAIDELASVAADQAQAQAQAERDKLRERNQWLNAVVDAAPTALVAVDLEDAVRLWNSAAERLFGWRREEVEGEPLPTLPDAEAGVEEFNSFLETLRTGERVTGATIERRRKDGEVIDLTLSKAPIRNDEGEIVGLLGSMEERMDEADPNRLARERGDRLQRYRAFTNDVLDAIDDVIYVLDEDGDVLRWNQALTELSGYPNAEIADMRAVEFFDDEDREAVAEAIDAVLETGEARIEVPVVTADGEHVPLEFSASRLEDASGRTVIVGVGRDITDRRAKERELERYRQFTNDVLDAIDDVFYVLEKDGSMRRWNEAVGEVTGYTDDEIAEMNALEFFGEEDRPAIRDSMREAFETGDTRVEAGYRTRDGEQIPYEFVATVLEDPDGTPVEVGIGRDISDRKRYERELEAATERLDSVVSNAPVILYAVDDDGVFTFSEGAGLEALGFESGEVVGESVEDVYADHDGVLGDVERALAGEQVDAVREVGNTIFESSYQPVFDDDGEVTEIIGVAIDVTERKRRERELRERERELSRLMSNVPGMVYRCRNERGWPFEFVSDGCVDLTGYEPAALVSGEVDWGEDVVAEDHDELWEEVQAAVDDREPYTVTFPIETADGERRWMSEQGRGVYAEDGSLEHLEGVIIDVTDRIESERELERTRALLEQAQRLAGVGGWEIDVRSEPFDLEVTDQTARIHGVSPADGIDFEEFREFVHSDDRPQVTSAFERAVTDREPYDLEFRIYTADGETRWVRSVGEPVVDDRNGRYPENGRPGSDGEVVAVRGSVQDVTGRTERERELERYETIVQALGELVYVIDEEGYFRFVNDALTELTGHEPAELIGEHASTIMTDEDVEAARDQIRELLRADVPSRTFEIQLETKAGDVLDAENHIALLPMLDGEFAGTAGVIRDVTDRKERERELERTRDLLNRVQRLAKVGGWELDLRTDPREAIWSEELYRLHDLPTDVSPDLETTIQCYHPEDRDLAREMVETSIETATGYDFEARLLTREGEVRWVRAVSEPIFDENGDLIKFRGSVRDVTEQKARERELERTKARLEQTSQLASVGGWELDVREEPYTLQWTAETARIHGLDPEIEMDVEQALEYYHPKDVETVRSAVDRAIEDGESYVHEVRLLPEDGERRWVRSRGEPIVEDGDVVAVHGSIQDVTERKERERELERTRALLQRVEELANIGGWELDLRSDPPTPTWTNELYHIHGMPVEEPPDLGASIEKYHPDDKPRVRAGLENAIENGEIYDVEARLYPAPDDLRWVRAVGVPVFEDGELVKIHGALKDVTERKERELALESLHETARGLLGTESVEEVARLAVETADDVLDVDGVALYRLDDDRNQLVPVDCTDRFVESTTGESAMSLGNGDAIPWRAFVTGTQQVLGDPDAIDRSSFLEPAVESAVAVPIGRHGVFVVTAESGAIDEDARQLIETLVATTEAALDRLESEAALRERDDELESQNERLRRQVSVTETIRRINGSLVGVSSRDEIERTVPERLVEDDDIAFAWIGAADPSGTSLETLSWAGGGEEYLDAVSFDLEEAVEPACLATRRGEATIVENVIDGLRQDAWRRRALEAGFQSVVAVPLALEEYSYGVLAVYGTEPNTFTTLERAVFAELGETIANAITATRTREALHAETLLELTVSIDDSSDVLSQLATQSGAGVSFEGLGTQSGPGSGSESRVFFQTTGVEPDAIEETLEGLVSVSGHRLLACTRNGDEDGNGSDGEGPIRCRFEALVTGDVLAPRLVRHGASPRSIEADGTETLVTAELPAGTDVREFVQLLTDHYGETSLERRQYVDRSSHTRRELVTSLFDSLTDRQLEVLRTAYYAGYFEWPRESTGEDVAEMLSVSQPTINRHLRIAQQRLFEQLLEPGHVADVGA